MFRLGALHTLLALSANNPATYRIRPFDVTKDQTRLEEICENVYGGEDYLPSVAPALASDPRSNFVALTDAVEHVDAAGGKSRDEAADRVVAVANLRRLLPRAMWLEAVRTCETMRNRGLARILTLALIERARDAGDEVLTCTVGSNAAMRKVLERAGMANRHTIHLCSFDRLKGLPGWGAGDDRTPQPLLRALDAESLIRKECREMGWALVRSRAELDDVLGRVRKMGGLGHLPGAWKILGDDTVEDSLKDELVFRLQNDDEEDASILAFHRDGAIQSLRSNWVCSLAATSLRSLEAALWLSCSPGFGTTLGGDVAFVLAVDGAVPVHTRDSICDVLPWTRDPCLVYTTES